MPKRVFMVHGWEGTPDSNWFPWLTRELEARGFKVTVPEMPNTDNPDLQAWLSYLTKAVGTPDKDTYLIGHSLGCITILRYLESLEEGGIGGAVLVAGFSGDLGIKEIKNFLEKPVDWVKVNARCIRFVAINSDNDPYVPLKYGELFKQKLNAELIVRHKGHFSDGMTELPEALEAVVGYL